MDTAQLKELGIRYGHWVALGFALFMVASTYLFDTSSEEERLRKRVLAKKGELDTAIKNLKAPPLDKHDSMKEIKHNWEEIYNVQDTPNHSYLYPPALITFKYEVAPTHQWISAPESLEVEVGREQITITWQEPPVLRDEEGKKREMTKIKGYLLVKSWNEEGSAQTKKEETIDIPGKENTTYDDDRVESRVDYFYKVCAYTLNVEAKGGKQRDFEGKDIVASPFSQEDKGQIKPLYQIRLKGIGGSKTNASALVELDKWEQGAWRTTSCWIKKGQKIYKEVKISGLERPVKFNPGWNLTAISPKKRPPGYEYFEKSIYNKKTRKMEKITKKRKKNPVAAIQYKDDKGKKHTVYQTFQKKKQQAPSEG